MFLGPYNNGVKEKLHDLSLQYLKENKGDRFYYLLPNRELLNHYRNKFTDELGASFELNFLTFDDIVTNIMEDNILKIADDTIKKIIMRKILKKLSDESKLSYYKNFTDYKGFVESCIYIIGRIKRSLVTPEEYLSKCGDSPYYKEVGIIYKEYERELKDNGFQDKDSLYLETIDLLKNHKNILKKLDFIIIDEFYDFRPIELEIINLIKDLDINIYINIPYNIKAKNIRLKETISNLDKLGFQIEKISENEFNEFENLGNILFHDGHAQVEANIELIKASSMELEIKKILKTIKNNYSYNSVDLKENCLCVFNNDYSNMILKVAEEEKLPISMDYTVSLKNLPLTKEILSLIEFNLYSGDKEILLSRVKSAYLSLCHDSIKDSLEYVLRKSKFNNLDDLYKKITEEKEMDIGEKYREDILQVLDHLKEETCILDGKTTLKDFNIKLLELLEDYKLENNIINRYEANGDFKLLQRDLANLKAIKEILENMEATDFLEDDIDLEEYLMILMDYFQDESIIESRGNSKGVKVITIDNIRGIQYKNVFIPGLTQRVYPNLMSNNYFFSDDNYFSLKDIGIDVKSYKNRLDNEILKFVSLISSSTEKIYITCNLESEGDENPLYSIFLDEILHKLPGEKEEDKLQVTNIGLDFLFDNEIQDITSHREFSLKIYNDYYKSKVDLPQLQYHNSLFSEKTQQVNLQLESTIRRSSRGFDNYSGLLEGDFSKEYMIEQLKNKSFSVSFLENYSICPYAFLLNYIFNIEELERERQDYNPMDSGTIYHEVLRLYYENFRDELNNIDKFKVSDTFDFLKETILREALKLGYEARTSNELLLIEDMYNKLKDFIEYDIKRLRDNPDIKPWAFEEWFSMDFKTNENSIEIRGIIDRIDKENDKYLIIDYKSSAYGKRSVKDIENKISLQLPIYIMSQKDKDIVGGFYSIIKKPEFYTCMGLLGESNLVNKRQAGAMDIESWERILTNTELTINHIVKSIYQADFSVNPRECSPYCIYKDICRYDKVQEVEE